MNIFKNLPSYIESKDYIIKINKSYMYNKF